MLEPSPSSTNSLFLFSLSLSLDFSLSLLIFLFIPPIYYPPLLDLSYPYPYLSLSSFLLSLINFSLLYSTFIAPP